MAEYEGPRPAQSSVDDAGYRKKLIVGFGLFAVFFLFYMGTAILQTPAFKSTASIPCLGMPLGLLLSMAIFPVSWLLIIIFFIKSR